MRILSIEIVVKLAVLRAIPYALPEMKEYCIQAYGKTAHTSHLHMKR